MNKDALQALHGKNKEAALKQLKNDKWLLTRYQELYGTFKDALQGITEALDQIEGEED